MCIRDSSRTGLGLVAVCDAQQQVQGVFTDGDLRRWLVAVSYTHLDVYKRQSLTARLVTEKWE